LLIVLTKSWRALFFSFWFQIEEEVPSTELSCYGFKTQGMNFMYRAIFSFLWLLKTCPVVVERMGKKKKKNWFGKRVNSIFKVKWVVYCRVITKVKMCVCLFVWLGIKSPPFSSSTGPNYFHRNKLCVLGVNFRQNSIGQLSISKFSRGLYYYFPILFFYFFILWP
jgi:hypothetical protein